MWINTVCDDVELMNIISIFKSLINFACIIVPIILVIFLIIDVIKTISSGDVDTKKLSKSITKRLMAAVMVFLVPIILNLVINIIPTGNLYYLACYENASKEKIKLIAEDNVANSLTKLNSALNQSDYENSYLLYEETRLNVKKLPDKSKREHYNKLLTEKYKPLLNSLKFGNSINFSNDEGSIQTTPSKSLYTYQDVEKILKKYKNLSEERKNIVLTAAKYKGEIPYYWGGTATSSDFKSNNFNTTTISDQYGNNKKGLDCSHFVDFVFWQVTGDNLGNSNTVYIWDNRSYRINKSELLPGDVGFQINYDIDRSNGNHIGIYVGEDDNGNMIWIHEAGDPYNNVVINNVSLPNYRRINIIK